MHDNELQLERIVRCTPWLVAALSAVREAGPPGAYIGAGAVRDTVWNTLTGRPASEPTGDVDVVYFDTEEPIGSSNRHEAALSRRLGSVRWELTNQAFVHLWYRDAQGFQVRACRGVAEGVATWPETATAVAIRLAGDDALDVIAPLGLEDLFGLIVRHNPARASATTYEGRIRAKKWESRWPELRIVSSGSTA